MDVPERWWARYLALVILLAVPITTGAAVAVIWFDGLNGWTWRDELLAGLISVVAAAAMAAAVMRLTMRR